MGAMRPPGQQVLKYFDGIAAVRHSADQAISSVSSFIHERILRQSKEATAPPTPSAPIPPAPSANSPAPPTPPSAAPAPPPAAPAGLGVSTPSRDARGKPPSRSAAKCGAAREDRYPWSRCCAPFEDVRPRAFEDIIPEGVSRHSRMTGPCIGGVGSCYWGGGQY
jgi:hypothetical protein